MAPHLLSILLPSPARTPAWALGAALALVAPEARARTPDPEETSPLFEEKDEHERETYPRAFDERSPLWLAIDTSFGKTREGESAFSTALLLGLPLERLGSRTRTMSGQPRALAQHPLLQGAEPRPRPAPAITPTTPSASTIPAPSPELTAGSDMLPRAPVRITPGIAREAVESALRRAGLLDPEAPLRSLASRSRISALLPELRLRASRTMEEGQALSPTAYDPQRTTATGGNSLWLEARATWRLDRLVFTDDELTIERLKQKRVEARAQLSTRVLALLFAWQRALAIDSDASRLPEERLEASLHAIEAEAELDLLTGGWFCRWRAYELK